MHYAWLSSTIANCHQEFRTAVFFSRQSALKDQRDESKFYVISRYLLPLIVTKVFVTPASGFRRFRMPLLARNRVHMPHSLASFHMIYVARAFDGYDTIFCAGPHHYEEVAARDAVTKKRPRNRFKIGYGKMDVLLADFDSYKPKECDAPTILLAPSWGEENIIVAFGEELIEGLLLAGYNVIVRPHPQVTRDNGDLIRKFWDRFGSTGRLTLDLQPAENKSLFQADLMISDYSGVAFEFAFLRSCPVLFVDLPRKIINANYELLGLEPFEVKYRQQVGKIVAPSVEAIISGVAQLLKEKDEYRTQIEAGIEGAIYNAGGCAEAATEAIKSLVGSK